MENQKTYTLDEIIANLENSTSEPCEKSMKRVKLPIPKEYGGGWATGVSQEDAVRNLLERVRGQFQPVSEAPIFEEAFNDWLFIKTGQNRSPCTIDNYKRIGRVRLVPFFGKKKVDEITPDDIQLYFNSIINLSKSYGIQSRAILRGIFDRAERMNYISSNPMRFDYVRPMKTKEKIVLQDDDLVEVIESLEKLNGPDYLYVCFLCFTALRRGEILGLTWQDLDFENKTVSVRNNVIFPDGCNEPIVKAPKDDSFGVVHMHSELEKRIKPYRQLSGYVIGGLRSGSEEPVSKSSFWKMWSRIKKTVDLKGATSHSFRATYATMMNAHCLHIDPKALQGALRHKTPDLAIKVYTKQNDNKTRQAEIEYDEWLSSQVKQTS